ncbi:MAG TPA: hypothetical protein PLW34_03215 [Termitinemataceae bacterium]|nr:hypothetical protein [Termitinemataceae bacterium]HOM22757.1 hypothetical protein [Termitinemataceae bacterium]HPQ00667.1 hypothetical protein [Termitinemataceae bacterium]
MLIKERSFFRKLVGVLIGSYCWITIVGGPPALPAADLTVPLFEIASFGTITDNTLKVSSLARTTLALQGGYKYGATLRLALASRDLSKSLGYGTLTLSPVSAAPTADDYNKLIDRLNNQAYLGFELAKVRASGLFNLPLELAYFVGYGDVLCSGDDFSFYFGSPSIGTSFRGLSYFPQGINEDMLNQYDGIHQIIGTGFQLTGMGNTHFVPILYIYQDGAMLDSTTGLPKEGIYSTDLRLLANTPLVKFEFFAGATYPYESWGLYRGGILAYFSTESGAGFLTQIGIPAWKGGESFSIDNLYVLFEPRMHFGPVGFTTTVFYHPIWYHQRQYLSERGSTDINIQLYFRNEDALLGGIENTLYFRSSPTEDTLSWRIAPFLRVTTDGLRWDWKVRINPLAYQNIPSMFEIYLSVRTAY